MATVKTTRIDFASAPRCTIEVYFWYCIEREESGFTTMIAVKSTETEDGFYREYEFATLKAAMNKFYALLRKYNRYFVFDPFRVEYLQDRV